MFEGCPADQTEVTLDSAPLAVTWVPPTATDNSREYSISINNDHAPGRVLNVGMYDVVYVAIDPSGNVDTCEFTITVESKSTN